MFKYLVVARNRAHFLIEEDSGRGLYRTREFLGFLKKCFPEVVFTKFKGTPVGPGFADADLILVVPRRPGPDLLGQLLEGYSTVLVNGLDPAARLSIPRQALKIELAGRDIRGTARELAVGNDFETATHKLVAILRMDAIDPSWLRGTRARVSAKQRFAFFIRSREDEPFRGKRGTVVAD
jgi:hypothetical protein